MADPFDQQNSSATSTATHSAPSSPASSSRMISNGVTHTVSSNSGVSASGGIKVKIKRTGSTDSRQGGPSKLDHHEIIHSQPGGNGVQSSQNGSKRSSLCGAPGSGPAKKEKLKLTVTSAGTGDYSLSDKAGSLSSSLDSSPATNASSATSSGSGSSAASSPVIAPKDQHFILRQADPSPLRRQLTGGISEPPSKKSKTNQEDNSAKGPEEKPVNGVFMNGSSPEKENDASEIVRSADGKYAEAETMTEMDKLGPHEPGSIVKLNGVVVQESEKGMLVLNVCWKGKTFMGALVNVSKSSDDHKWAPPKDPAIYKRKRGRGNRSRTPPVKIPISKKGKPNGINVAKGGACKERAQRLPRVNYGESDDEDLLKGIERSCGETKQPSPTSQYIECPKPHCSKKFPVLEALKYHLSSKHVDEDEMIKRKKKEQAEKSAAKENKKKVVEEEEKPATDDEMKPTDLSTPAVNGSANQLSKSRPPPPPTTSSIKPSPNIQGVNYLSTTAKSLDGPPNAHSNSHRPSVPSMVHNGTYSATTSSPSQPLALNNKPKPSKPPGGPVSPAYSDISDEETPVILPPPPSSNISAPNRIPPIPGPGGILNNWSGAGGPRPIVSKPSTVMNLVSTTLDRKTDGSAPTTQTIGPPPQHLPPELHGGSLMFPPPTSSVMSQYAAMIAAMGGQRLPMMSQGIPGLPVNLPVNNKKALDVMAQHANNYSASRKLQEMQESVKKPQLPPQPNRTPPPNPRPSSANILPSSQPATSMFSRMSADPVTVASNLLRHEHNHTHLHLGYPPGFPPVSSSDLTAAHGTPPRGPPPLPSPGLPPAAHGGTSHPSLIPGLFGPPIPGFRLPANFPPK